MYLYNTGDHIESADPTKKSLVSLNYNHNQKINVINDAQNLFTPLITVSGSGWCDTTGKSLFDNISFMNKKWTAAIKAIIIKKTTPVKEIPNRTGWGRGWGGNKDSKVQMFKSCMQ